MNTGSEQRLNVGIVGFGRIGAEHAGWLSAASNIRPAAVFDPTPARQDLARQRGLRVFDTLQQLLGDPSIDVVLVSSPTAMHFDEAAAALRAGKHVLVEKPMALDASQAGALITLAKPNGRVLSVFHNRRWDIDYLALCAAIRAGELGTVFNVESRIGQWASCVGPATRDWHPTWRNEAEYGGGGLFDWGSHFLDQLWRMMLPAHPVRVFAQLRGNVWTRDCDDLARVCVDFDSGAVGMVEINTTTTAPLPRWHVDASRGSVQAPFSLEFDLDVWSELTFTPSDGGPRRRLATPQAAVLSETKIWERFAAAVRGEGQPAVTAQSVLPTMALLDAARQSSESGRTVDLSPDVRWSDE